jgi:hypothetical protein
MTAIGPAAPLVAQTLTKFLRKAAGVAQSAPAVCVAHVILAPGKGVWCVYSSAATLVDHPNAKALGTAGVLLPSLFDGNAHADRLRRKGGKRVNRRRSRSLRGAGGIDPERVNRLRQDVNTARAHGIRISIEPFLYCLDNLLVLPPRYATFPSCRALSLDWAGAARIGPITVKFLAVLLRRKAILEFLTSRASINVFIG